MMRFTITLGVLFLSACAGTPSVDDNSSFALRVAKPAFGGQAESLRDAELRNEQYQSFKEAATYVDQALYAGIGQTMGSALGNAFSVVGLFTGMSTDHSRISWTLHWAPRDRFSKEEAVAQLTQIMMQNFTRNVSDHYRVSPRAHPFAGMEGNTKRLRDGFELIGPGCPDSENRMCWVYPDVSKWTVVKGKAPVELGGFDAWIVRGKFEAGLNTVRPDDYLKDGGLHYGKSLPSSNYFFLGSFHAQRLGIPIMLVGRDGAHYFVQGAN